MKKAKFQPRKKSMKPEETMKGETQKADMGGNMADKALGNLMKGNVLPSHGKSIKRPTGANKDRRTK